MELTSAASLDGLILCGIPVNYKVQEYQKWMDWGFFSCCLLGFNSVVLFFVALSRCCETSCASVLVGQKICPTPSLLANCLFSKGF